MTETPVHKTAEELGKEIDEWVKDLEWVTLTQGQFESLLEYSTTIPTGKTIGKQWRRQLYYGEHRGEWVRCEYVPDKEDPEQYVGMEWKRIKVEG